MMRKLLSLALLWVSLFVFSQQLPYYQQHVKYDMFIDVDAQNYTYEGHQRIEYTNNSPDELEVLYMHLYWNAFRPGSMMDQRVQNRGAHGDGRLITKNAKGKVVSRLAGIPADQQGAQNIHWIEQEGISLKYEIQGGTILKIYLDEPLKPHSSTTLAMEWDAVIPQQIRRSGRNNQEGIEMTMTQWYPKMAEYDYDGWAAFDYVGREFHAPFADFDVTIKIDPSYVIGAGGTLVNSDEVKGYSLTPNIKTDKNGKATWHWKAENILDFAWAADPDYTVEDFTILGGPKVYYVYQKSEKTYNWELSKPYVTQYFQLMNKKFGKYHWPSYSFVQGGDGGMEYGMCTMILGEGRSLKGLLGLMFHEASHSWYQQMLATNESMYPWMDEGFTSYAETFILSKLMPSEKPQPNPFIRSIQGYINFTKSGLEEPASWLGDHHKTGAAYSYASYVKGELFLVQLSYIMGEQNLDKTMYQYFTQWNMKHPTPRDFMHIAQKTSKMDLKWFYDAWINSTKTIDYAIKNIAYDPSSTTITLVNKGSIAMPIDFNVLTRDKKILTYHIPLNMMRTPKTQDAYGTIMVMPYWNWTQKEYKITIPYNKIQLRVLGIDFSQRLADVNPTDNFINIEAQKPKAKSTVAK